MTHRLALVLSVFLAAPAAIAQAAETDAQASEDALFQNGETATLEEFRWIKRPLVIFADTDRDPRFAQQMELLNALPDELAERDVVVLSDTNPGAKSALREALRPRGFMLVLIGKDGNPYLRKPFPWDVRAISASIDKMPLRQQEIRDSHRPSR
ncbi:DUF4174 domain-containing protein [Shimia aestuarii]|uniref:DUF4174 domain-containing protein n=1 Tax=Shimia aestuarii TaxID=254406 RepID=A0A1I4RIF4_9RHOB|nr:DUF4174 domain-containing protein [Shimia aestuarii]SFM52005.1 protein of unknown function [Shimia aestuarii]